MRIQPWFEQLLVPGGPARTNVVLPVIAALAAITGACSAPVPSPSAAAASSPPVAASATEPGATLAFYVSPNGSSSGRGAADDPWDIDAAGRKAPAGSTVYLRGGTYDGLNVSVSGTAEAPIRFVAYPGEQPVIDGARNSALYTVVLDNVANVELRGLVIQGGHGVAQSGGGILVGSSSAVVIDDNTVRDNSAFGVRVLDSQDVVVANNDVSGNGNGIRIAGEGEGTVVRDNQVHDNDVMMVNTPDIKGDDVGGEAISLVHSTGHVLVTGNTIWGNRAVSYDYGYDGGAFSIYASSNWTITGNTTWNNRNILETGTDANKTPCANNTFTRNLNYGATTVDMTVGMVLRCASNMLVANNTFAGLQGFVFDLSSGSGAFGGSIDGLRILNNVASISDGDIYKIETPLPEGVVLDYNLMNDTAPAPFADVMGTDYHTLASFAASIGQEAHGIAADPLFVFAAAHDYHLAAASPAIDSGMILLGITDGFTGKAPDRGYAEFSGPSSGDSGSTQGP